MRDTKELKLYRCHECGPVPEKYLTNHQYMWPEHLVDDQPDAYYEQLEKEENIV